MKNIVVLIMAIGASIAPVHAEDLVHPTAADACKAESSTFVELGKCLPGAHVAAVILEQFDLLYSVDASPIKQVCTEKNGSLAAVGVCVIEAIKTAIETVKVLPKGFELNDTVFEAVKSEKDYADLVTAIETAKRTFPDKLVWGGTLFYSY